MSKKEDPLFTLVKSLSSAERSYFKKFVSGSEGKKSQYIILFDAISSLPEYDEKLLKTKIPGQPLVRHLAVTKNYLFHLILKCLNSYYSARNPERQVQELILNADILLKKGLHGYAGKLLHKAKHLAGGLHDDLLKIAILTQLARYYSIQDDPDPFEEFMNQFEKEGGDYLQRQAGFMRSVVLLSKVVMYVKRGSLPPDTQNFKHLFEKEARLLEEQKLSFPVRHNLYAAYLNYYQLTGNYSAAYQYAQKDVLLFESDEQVIRDRTDIYVVCLHTLMLCAMLLKRYDEFWKVSKKLRQVPVHYASSCGEIIRLRVFRAYHLDLYVYCATGKFREGMESAKDIQSPLNRYGNKLGKTFQVVFYHNLACLYFGGGNYRSVLKWLNLLMHDKSLKTTSTDVHRSARILNLMLQVEMGKIYTLRYTVQAARRYFSTHGKLYRTEAIALRYFDKYPKKSSKAELKTGYLELKNELEPLKNDPAESRILEETWLIPWLESKLSGKKTLEV